MTLNTEGVDSPEVDEKTQQAVDAALAAEKEINSKTLEEQVASLKAISADAIKTRDQAKRKLRDFELANEKATTEAQTYKERLISRAVNDSLKAALVDAGVLSIETALKLIDKNTIKLSDEFEADPESIKAVVTALKETDKILFKAEAAEDKVEEKAPVVANPVKRPGDKANLEDAYKVALSACKTEKDLKAVMEKFGVRV